eukprot:44388-Chlamydomonas_euryale.AAC.1
MEEPTMLAYTTVACGATKAKESETRKELGREGGKGCRQKDEGMNAAFCMLNVGVHQQANRRCTT